MENLRTALAPLFAQYQATSNPVSDRFEADHTGLDALFDDVKIFVNNGMIIVRNKLTSQVIFQGPIDNIASGTFYNQNMPIVVKPGSGSIDGVALYSNKCRSCHGALATSSKRGRTASQIQAAISANAGGMGSLSTLNTAEIQAIAAALGSTTATPTPTPTSTPGAIDGAALYTQYCSGCHGSGKKGSSATSIQNAISSNRGGMGSLSGLTSAQILAIATGGTTPAPTPTPTPTPTDGAALYTTYCSGCHGPLATSGHRGATVSQIQTGINTISGMMSLSTLTSAQIQAIATALGSTTPTPTPTPTACGSCHTIPPATGHHAFHVNSQGVSCSTCHGTGYSKTTVNTATHQNGVVNIASTPGWNPTSRTCSNSCHGSKSW
jgi:mono/diheme cytochrome c family protein